MTLWWEVNKLAILIITHTVASRLDPEKKGNVFWAFSWWIVGKSVLMLWQTRPYLVLDTNWFADHAWKIPARVIPILVNRLAIAVKISCWSRPDYMEDSLLIRRQKIPKQFHCCWCVNNFLMASITSRARNILLTENQSEHEVYDFCSACPYRNIHPPRELTLSAAWKLLMKSKYLFSTH